MIKLQLTSHYLKIKLNVILPNDKAEKLMNSTHPTDNIHDDIYRVQVGYEPIYLSRYQISRIANYLNGTNDYWNEIKYLNNN